MIPEIAIIAAGSIAAHSLSAGMHMINGRRISALERAMKFQRIELTTLEVVSGVSAIMQIADELCWRKEFKELSESTTKMFNDLSLRMDYINDRLNRTSLDNIEAKLDKLEEATTQTTPPTTQPIIDIKGEEGD